MTQRNNSNEYTPIRQFYALVGFLTILALIAYGIGYLLALITS